MVNTDKQPPSPAQCVAGRLLNSLAGKRSRWPQSSALPGNYLLVISVLASALCYGQAQPPVIGQNTGLTRSIEGVVLDKDKNPVAGAVVLVKDTKTLQVRSYIAQSGGQYHFYGLSTDINYELRAAANGLTSKTKTVSVFDSHKVVKLNLKVYKKLKSDS